MNEAILTQAQKLYGEAHEIVAEECKLRQKSGRNLVRLASILSDLYETFLRREDPRERLVLVPRQKGFADFREAMLELLRPLDMGERNGWYYVSIGRHLLGKIPESQLADMGFEKVKQLARVAKAKNEVPANIVDRAKDEKVSVASLREEVDVLLYKGNSDHSEGPKRSLVLVDGEQRIRGIKKKIDQLRPAVTEEGAGIAASDAKVVEYALADCLAGIQEEEDHHMTKLRQGRG